MVTKNLRRWFVAHFFIDMMFAIPLLLFPAWFLSIVGLEQENLILARFVGSALLAIGGVSLIMHKKDEAAYSAMLQLKLLWSGTVSIAIVLSFADIKAFLAWILLAIFVVFFFVWGYYFTIVVNKKI